MKKRLLICCSLITLGLTLFSFPIYAEEDSSDYSSNTSIITSAALDQYFYDNYELLPYVESNGNQYIDTGVLSSSNTRISLSFGNLKGSGLLGLFGTYPNGQMIRYQVNDNEYTLSLINSNQSYDIDLNQYTIFNFVFDRQNVYYNSNLIHSFDVSSWISTNNLFVFAYNLSGEPRGMSLYRLYRFSIYDYSANEGEGALIRDYYPARTKASGVIGLYDAVNKTFVTTSGSVPFDSPIGDTTALSLGANITQFLSGSLTWIGAIFEGINEMPIIWVFIAIGFAGVMFRWTRRLVHF